MAGLSLRFLDGKKDYVINHYNYEFFFEEEQFVRLISNIQVINYKKCNAKIVYDPNLLVRDYATETFKRIREHFNVFDLELEQ